METNARVILAQYAKDKQLLDTVGWKTYKRDIKHEVKFARMVNQAKLKSYRRAPKYKYGYQVPQDFTHAMQLDAEAGNGLWGAAIQKEIGQIDEYAVFKDHGKGEKPPSGYQKITCHFVFDVKHDGTHKARFVAGGHRTPVPLDGVYSSVVSLRRIRTVAFLAEHNDLELWATAPCSTRCAAIGVGT